jgi:hypothetical protein
MCFIDGIFHTTIFEPKTRRHGNRGQGAIENISQIVRVVGAYPDFFLKSVCKLVTETKKSVSQKEVTKPEPSGLFSGEATTLSLWSLE